MSASANADPQGLEIEIKLRLTDPQALIDRIAELSFRCVMPKTHEYNIILDSPGAELASKNTLLRLRRWGTKCSITLKTPPLVEQRRSGYKVRREVEIAVDDFAKTEHILAVLGYLPVFRYEKYRSQYESPEGLVLTLDETPIGYFCELEGRPELIDRCVVALGYRKSDAIRHNYRSLFLQSGRSGDMLFRP